jgi:hypothetical protein
MAESKRTFTRAKINRDIEEKILPPGEYRDALNISVDFSEDGNVGAIENLKGNELIANQNIYGLSASSNPNATVIGSYAHPEEKKIYYFVTGDEADGIFEYNVTLDTVKTIIIDSIKASVVETINLTFENAGVSGSVTQDGTIILTSREGADSIQSITQNFLVNETGSPISRKVTASLKVPPPYSNEGEVLIGSITVIQPSKTAPEVETRNIVSKTETTATLLGSLTNNSVDVTTQGFYYGYNVAGTALTISELKNGGVGITNFLTSSSVIKNNFTADITSLPSSTLISYAAYATNAVGTTDGSVLTFTTDTPPPVSRISGTEYVVVPVIQDTIVGNTDEVDNRNTGYGSFFKSSGDCYINISAPSADGVYDNATETEALWFSNTITSTPSGLTFDLASGGSIGKATTIYVSNFAADTSYQISIPSLPTIAAKNIRINNGTPTTIYYTSTLTLNLSGVFVAKLDSGGYQYNTTPSPVASFILGPTSPVETAQAIIPLNDVNTLITSVVDTAFKSSFNPANIEVTVTGKTKGVDFDYYVENGSTSMFGIVPGIIFEGTPERLGATPTVNITYTP